MLKLDYQPYLLPFKHPFRTAKGTKEYQKGILLSLRMGQLIGYGEMTSINYYPSSDIDESIALLEKNRMVIERYALISPQRFWHFLHHLLPNNNFLIAALEMAAWDLWGKMQGVSLYEALNLSKPDSLRTSYTIGISTPEQVVEKICEHPLHFYKLKLGSENDIACLTAARQSTDASIGIDANSVWEMEDVKKILPLLKEYQIAYIEQPTAIQNGNVLSYIKQNSSIPILADESFTSEQQLNTIGQYYDGINIKLAKLGGITPALNIMRKARNMNLKIMIGNMCEDYCGSSALAHLSSLADYIDLDGPLLLETHIGSGIGYENGKIVLKNQPGIGFAPNI